MSIISIAVFAGLGLIAIFAMKTLGKALLGLAAFVTVLGFIAYSSSHGPILNPSIFAG